MVVGKAKRMWMGSCYIGLLRSRALSDKLVIAPSYVRNWICITVYYSSARSMEAETGERQQACAPQLRVPIFVSGRPVAPHTAHCSLGGHISTRN